MHAGEEMVVFVVLVVDVGLGLVGVGVDLMAVGLVLMRVLVVLVRAVGLVGIGRVGRRRRRWIATWEC